MIRGFPSAGKQDHPNIPHILREGFLRLRDSWQRQELCIPRIESQWQSCGGSPHIASSGIAGRKLTCPRDGKFWNFPRGPYHLSQLTDLLVSSASQSKARHSGTVLKALAKQPNFYSSTASSSSTCHKHAAHDRSGQQSGKLLNPPKRTNSLHPAMASFANKEYSGANKGGWVSFVFIFGAQKSANCQCKECVIWQATSMLADHLRPGRAVPPLSLSHKHTADTQV